MFNNFCLGVFEFTKHLFYCNLLRNFRAVNVNKYVVSYGYICQLTVH